MSKKYTETKLAYVDLFVSKQDSLNAPAYEGQIKGRNKTLYAKLWKEDKPNVTGGHMLKGYMYELHVTDED